MLRETLGPAESGGRCQLEPFPNATLDELKKALRAYRDRVAIFHYGGHAGPDRLLLRNPPQVSAKRFTPMDCRGAIAPVPRISTKSGPFSPGEWLESLPGSARGY